MIKTVYTMFSFVQFLDLLGIIFNSAIPTMFIVQIKFLLHTLKKNSFQIDINLTNYAVGIDF